MRMMLKVAIPVEAGNAAVKGGTLPKTFETVFGMTKPEAAYFTTEHGVRTVFIFFDLKDSTQMPAIAEPLFEDLQAAVTWSPCMSREDLAAGLAALQR